MSKEEPVVEKSKSRRSRTRSELPSELQAPQIMLKLHRLGARIMLYSGFLTGHDPTPGPVQDISNISRVESGRVRRSHGSGLVGSDFSGVVYCCEAINMIVLKTPFLCLNYNKECSLVLYPGFLRHGGPVLYALDFSVGKSYRANHPSNTMTQCNLDRSDGFCSITFT